MLLAGDRWAAAPSPLSPAEEHSSHPSQAHRKARDFPPQTHKFHTKIAKTAACKALRCQDPS